MKPINLIFIIIGFFLLLIGIFLNEDLNNYLKIEDISRYITGSNINNTDININNLYTVYINNTDIALFNKSVDLSTYNKSISLTDYLTFVNLSNINVSNSTSTNKINCAGIYGGTDLDFCTDTTGTTTIFNNTILPFYNSTILDYPEPNLYTINSFGNSTSLFGMLETPYISTANYQNYILQSETLDTANWQKDNCTVISNLATDPTEALTAEIIRANRTDIYDNYGMARINQSFSSNVNGTWTVSLYAKTLHQYSAKIGLNLGTNLNNGTLQNITVYNNWMKISQTINISKAHTSKNINIYIESGANVSLWGVQVEPTDRPRPYGIATTTAQTTTKTQWIIARGAFRSIGSASTTSLSTGAITASSVAGTSTLSSSLSSVGIQNQQDGFLLTSSTATTAAAAEQNSPRIRLAARIWNNTADTTHSWSLYSRAYNTTNPKFSSLILYDTLPNSENYKDGFNQTIMNYSYGISINKLNIYSNVTTLNGGLVTASPTQELCTTGEIRGNVTASKICMCISSTQWKCATVT